jgi:hypothetical protein
MYGGRVAATEIGPFKSAPRLKAVLDSIFPSLRGVGITHSWMGFTGFSFDEYAASGPPGWRLLCDGLLRYRDRRWRPISVTEWDFKSWDKMKSPNALERLEPKRRACIVEIRGS